MKQDRRKAILHSLLVVFSLSLIVFILSMKSNYNFFLRGGNQTADGDVFRTVGWLMTKGYVPYRDIFDHKGPVLYFIQYLATFFAKVRGIWVIEILFLGITVFVTYLIGRRFGGTLASIFGILFTFSRYAVCGYGNSCEELSLPFIVVSMYFFLDYYLKSDSYITGDLDKRKKHWFDLRIAVVGFCFACVFLMKANFCAIWIVFCVGIFVDCIYNKHWNSLWMFVISFILGACIVVIPVAVYLIANNALADFFYDYFTFNGLYSSDPRRVNIKTIVNSVVTFSNTVPCIAAFVVMGYKLWKKENSFKLDIVYTIYMIVNIAMVTMSGQTYGKMEIPILVSFVYPLSCLLPIFTSKKDAPKKEAPLIAIVAGYFIITLIFPMWSSQINAAAVDVNKYINTPEKQGWQNNEAITYIVNNTEETDRIAVFGNKCVYYLYSDREPASKYIYLPDPKIEPDIIEEFFQDLREAPPKIIVDVVNYKNENKFANDMFEVFLKEYNYVMVLDGDEPVYQLGGN